METNIPIEWPKNLVVQGQLSFPLKSQQDIEQLAQWRERKGKPAPQFSDKIGARLILNQVNYDKAVQYLTDVYLPFVNTLYKKSKGAKGIEPDLVKGLLKQAKDGVWTDPLDRKHRPNMPIRDLTDKDRENMRDFPGVAKLSFMGPWQEDIQVKAIRQIDGLRAVQSIDQLNDEDILPEGYTDPKRLWWGSGWTFRTSLRFHAYDKANVGVSAYTSGTLFLLPDHGLPTFGSGGGDTEVLEDGDDADWD